MGRKQNKSWDVQIMGCFNTKECPFFEMPHKQWGKKMHWVRCP